MEGNIKIDLKRIGSEGMDWINLDQDKASVNMVMNLQFP
jgi:hypothetical protein